MQVTLFWSQGVLSREVPLCRSPYPGPKVSSVERFHCAGHLILFHLRKVKKVKHALSSGKRNSTQPVMCAKANYHLYSIDSVINYVVLHPLVRMNIALISGLNARSDH